MNFLIKYIGGSQLYGLETPQSDIDWRGVFVHQEPAKIFRFEIQDTVSNTGKENGGDDEVYYELHRYFQLLKKSNTQSIESLYVKEKQCLIYSNVFKSIHENPSELIDTRTLLKSTKGYAYGEYRLAMGERTGRLGGARFDQLQKYGFSPKNVCQMIRLIKGYTFLQKHGYYPLNIKEHIKDVWQLAYEIKTQPQNFSKKQIENICLDCIDELNACEDKLNWKFNQELVVSLMREEYIKYM